MDSPADIFAANHIRAYFSTLPADQRATLHQHFVMAYLEGSKAAFLCMTAEIPGIIAGATKQ